MRVTCLFSKFLMEWTVLFLYSVVKSASLPSNRTRWKREESSCLESLTFLIRTHLNAASTDRSISNARSKFTWLSIRKTICKISIKDTRFQPKEKTFISISILISRPLPTLFEVSIGQASVNLFFQTGSESNQKISWTLLAIPNLMLKLKFRTT